MTNRPWLRWSLWCAAGAGGLLLIFVLPWYVPTLGPPVISDSYAFGFSNGTAVLGCLIMAAGLALASYRWAPTFLTDGRGLWDTAQTPSTAERWATLGVAALSLCAVGVLGWLTHGSLYTESTYFLNRMAYAAAGHSPFADLHYPYSLVGLYLPIGLWRLFGRFGLDAQISYFVVFAVFTVLSWGMLYYVVGRLTLSSRQRLAVYLCLAATCLVPYDLGIQLLYVRFLTPLFGILLLHEFLRKHLLSASYRNELMAAALAGLVLALTLCLASADLFLAAGVALTAYLGFRARAHWPVGIVAPAVFLALWLASSLALGEYFAGVFSFGSGAYNFPVVPGPMMLILVACVGIAAAAAPPLLRSSRPRDRALLVAVFVLALAQLPAALGRADFIHVFWNGTLMFIMALAVLGRRSSVALAAALVTFTGLMVAAQVPYVDPYVPLLVRAGIANGALTQQNLRLAARVLGKDPAVGDWYYSQYKGSDAAWSRADLDGYPSLAAPLGFEDPLTGFSLAERGALSAFGAVNATSLAGQRTMFAARPAPRFLLLPAGLQPAPLPEELRASGALTQGGANNPDAYLRQLLLPVSLRQVNPQPAVAAVFSDYVWRHYRLVRSTGPYGVWERR